ncbi:MAG: Os1348 family NHLP clan protein [bacterium]
MSREGVVSFVTRAMEDEAFRAQLKANPDATLAQFDLTAEEIAAIKSADPTKLEHLGVDERVTKTTNQFTPMSGTDVMGSGTSLYTLLNSLFTKKS